LHARPRAPAPSHALSLALSLSLHTHTVPQPRSHSRTASLAPGRAAARAGTDPPAPGRIAATATACSRHASCASRRSRSPRRCCDSTTTTTRPAQPRAVAPFRRARTVAYLLWRITNEIIPSSVYMTPRPMARPARYTARTKRVGRRSSACSTACTRSGSAPPTRMCGRWCAAGPQPKVHVK
jgi:hypothetical protein